VTPTFTHTNTATITPTPAPQTTLYGFVILNETPPPGATPLPYAPLVVASRTLTADADGFFSITLNQNEAVSFGSGIDALEITRINGQSAESFSGTASEISALNPIVLTARSLISQGELCQAPFDNELHVVFPYTHRFSGTLSVPRGALNHITSASGVPVPPETFTSTSPELPDNSESFSSPLRDFIQSDGTLKVEWYLFGSLAPQQSPLPFCEMRGELGGCQALSLVDPSDIFRHVVNTALSMGDAVSNAAKARKVKLRGSVRKPFLMEKTAPELTRLKADLKTIPKLAFICPATPNACATVRIPKKEINARLESILRMKWPKEIKPTVASIMKLAPGARRELKRLLDRYPDTVTTCSSR
jgi:hypothetical protein